LGGQHGLRRIFVTRWTLRIAAIGLWGGALSLAKVSISHPSTFRAIASLVFVVWGFAVWRGYPRAIKFLTVALLAAGVLIPPALINPFHAIDASAAVVAESSFISRTIGTALVASAIAFAGAILLSRASRGIRRQTLGPEAGSDGLRSWRWVVVLLGVGWAIWVFMSVTAFTDAVRSTRRVREFRQEAGSIPSVPPNKPLQHSLNGKALARLAV
jgi:hypothetical protein